MSVLSDLQDTRTALVSLMKAKAEGASDLSEFYDRRLGALGITAASSFDKLVSLLAKLDAAIGREQGGAEETIVYV